MATAVELLRPHLDRPIVAAGAFVRRDGRWWRPRALLAVTADAVFLFEAGARWTPTRMLAAWGRATVGVEVTHAPPASPPLRGTWLAAPLLVGPTVRLLPVGAPALVLHGVDAAAAAVAAELLAGG
ncbi:MAG TPA: hypothetical protein VG452_07050 [Egibacteraceae bacterium]|nr:hypothetical protein [Egibacteraceae bacterium]